MIMRLREHLAAHPLRERAHGQLMRVLYAQGDAAAALQAYQNAREILDAELGLDPGPDLTRLQQAILRREPIVDERPAAVVVPRQLPPDITNLVGRDAELAALLASSAAVRAVHGPGGVGKSALIIRLAHELAPQFPDGQLYVDLQGSNPRLTPLTSAEVLARFIRAVSPSVTDLPAGPAEAATLFRSLIAGRRILIVLDNAVDVGQVRLLLPGTPGCGVLLTSRRALTALEDAEQLPLEVLGRADALELLGPAAAADENAAQRLADICGGLPLALRIVAARLKARPDWSLADFVIRLDDERRRLDELHADDLEVRATIEASYRGLDDAAARAFRMAGLIRVPLLSAQALAAALGVPVDIAVAAADALVEARLIEVDEAGYLLHDLVRLFAAERAAAADTEEERHSAVHRVCAYYLITARRAIEVHYGYLAPLDQFWSLKESIEVSRISSITDAIAWLDNEWRSAAAIAAQAVEGPSRGRYPAELVRSTMHFLTRRFQYDEMRRLAEMSVTFSEADDPWRSSALMAMATVDRRTGDLASARRLYLEVIDLRNRSGDLSGLAAVWNGLALLERFSGNTDEALRCFLVSEDAMRRSGNMQMQSYLLANIAEVHAQQGRHREAIHLLAEAMRVARPSVAVGFRLVALDALGRLYALLGEYSRALRCFGRCLALNDEMGDQQIRRDVLLSRAATYIRLKRGDLAMADVDLVCAEAVASADRYQHAAGLRLRSQASALLGENDRARQEMRQAETLFKRLDQPYELQVEDFLVGDDPTLPRPMN